MAHDKHSKTGTRTATRRKATRRKATRTSDFGAPGRVNHNSETFYGSRLYEGLLGENGDRTQAGVSHGEGQVENPAPADVLDRLYCKSSETMEELPDGSVHLMVTSPPYNASKQYDLDLNLGEYLGLLGRVWAETYRVLAPGGRACINLANLGRKPYIPLHAYVIRQMAETGFLMRGEIIWNKAASASASTAWGSWRSASNPVLRDVHEYILVFSKGSFRRASKDKESTISRDEFLAWTKSVWTFPAVSAKSVGHPAPFPEELPHRLIQLYTYKGDVVLDPFAGAGATCLAAQKGERHWVGYEVVEAYIELALGKISGKPPR